MNREINNASGNEPNVQALAPLVAGNVERSNDSEPKNDTDGTPLPAVASSALVLPKGCLDIALKPFARLIENDKEEMSDSVRKELARTYESIMLHFDRENRPPMSPKMFRIANPILP